MAHLIYSTIASLDGCVEDREGRFEWGAPDEEASVFINELERPIDTYLYGRRMYETMVYWETVPLDESLSPAERDFTESWQAADKIVYSRTLESVSSRRTRIERSFDAEAVRHLKASSEGDLTIGGADLAAQAIKAGLVDELQLFVVPVVVGGGKPWLPEDVHLDLQLLDTQRLGKAMAYLRYRLAS
jgi:dihydrofolate reductase